MSALYSHAIAAKLVVGSVITAAAAALSGCAPARFLYECTRGSLSCQ